MTAAHTANDPVRASLIERHGRVLAADRSVDAAQSVLDERRQRRSDLDRRATMLASGKPRQETGLTEELIAAVAADPSFRPDQAQLADAARQRNLAGDALGAWQAEVDLVEHAKPAVDRSIAAAERDVQAARAHRQRVWIDFVRKAHEYLIRELEARIAPIADEVLAPLAALSLETMDGSHGDVEILRTAAGRVSFDNRGAAIGIETPAATGFDVRPFFDWSEGVGRAGRASSVAALERFRASLNVDDRNRSS